MSKRNLCVGTVALILVMCAALFFLFKPAASKRDDLLAALPAVPDSRAYVLLETKEGNYPAALSSLLTEGPWALLHKGTSRNALLQLAPLAKDVAVLITDGETGYTDVYAAMRFAPHEMKKLEQGILPESWKSLLGASSDGNTTVEKGDEPASWKIWSAAIDAPLFYYFEGDVVVLAGDEETFARLLALCDDQDIDKRKHVWRDEPHWHSHIEIGSGHLLSQGDTTSPLRLQVAWNYLSAEESGDRAGEARWSISGLTASHKAGLFLAAKPREWVISNCIVPEPLMLTITLNIPEFKEPLDAWPFPLSLLVQVGKNIGLNDTQIIEALSGRTLFSLGGQNRILWFSLPGVLSEFTGDAHIMREMIDAFWGKFFFGSNPRPIEGFEYGGWLNIPFSVMGAGRGDLAVFGLISPESVRSGGDLAKYLNDRERAIGWFVADLPKLGDALGDMSRMRSLLMFEDGEGPGFISGSNETGGSGYFFSELDQSVSDSFARILRKFGKVAVIWEKCESGRMTWYK